MNEDFIVWLNQQLDLRGWSRSEAARRGGVSPSAFDKVIGGFAKPGIRFCRGVARAFDVPLEEVQRLAGILPQSGELLPEVRGWNVRLESLSAEDRRRTIAMMEQVLRFAEERPEYRARRTRSEL